jgi:hypothetical protein
VLGGSVHSVARQCGGLVLEFEMFKKTCSQASYSALKGLSCTYLFPTWNGILLEKLNGSQLIKKCNVLQSNDSSYS